MDLGPGFLIGQIVAIAIGLFALGFLLYHFLFDIINWFKKRKDSLREKKKQ